MRQKQYIINQCVTCKRERKENNKCFFCSSWRTGEICSSFSFPFWNEGVLSTKTMYSSISIKIWVTEMKNVGWGQFISLWIIKSLQNYNWVYIICVESIFLFLFYFFSACVLMFFVTPLEIDSKSKFCANSEQEEEREAGLAFSNVFKFIRFSNFFPQAFTLFNSYTSTIMNTK